MDRTRIDRQDKNDNFIFDYQRHTNPKTFIPYIHKQLKYNDYNEFLWIMI